MARQPQWGIGRAELRNQNGNPATAKEQVPRLGLRSALWTRSPSLLIRSPKAIGKGRRTAKAPNLMVIAGSPQPQATRSLASVSRDDRRFALSPVKEVIHAKLYDVFRVMD